MPPNTRNPGLALAFSSAFAYTCFDTAVKAFLHEITVWGMLFIRGLIGIAIVMLLARVFRRRLWGGNRAALAAVGLCGFLSSVCNATSVASIPLYQALVLIYLYPVFTLLLAAPFNNETVARRDLILVGLALLGCVILVWPNEAIGLTIGWGHLIGVSGALLYSLGQVLIRRLGDGNSGLEPTFFYSLYAVVLSLPLAYIFSGGMGISTAGGFRTALALAALGVASQGLGYAALRWLPGFKVGLIGTLELPAGTVISWLLFNDPMSPRALFGGLIIVIVAFQLRKSALTASRPKSGDVDKIIS
ncbi:hypothetical protein C4J81_00480 [Deltaproteobacteria bacterium Smac51]|nr:hypothetical protein C4J81_00480 [Deltaproteobacteria bacterium Smac51]